MGPGNAHDRRRLEEVLGGLRVKKSGRGRARRRPKGVYADAAYDAKAIREGLRRRGIRAGIPKNPRRGKGTRGGKRAFRRRKADRKARSSVERFFGWRKGGFRRLTVRPERRLSIFLAFVLLAGFLIAWRILRGVRFIFVAGDLLSGAPAPPTHHHPQGARHFRRGHTPAIHRRPQGRPKRAPAVPTDPTGPPTLTAVLYHMGGPTARAGGFWELGFRFIGLTSVGIWPR
jgi:hypothetical protein